MAPGLETCLNPGRQPTGQAPAAGGTDNHQRLWDCGFGVSGSAVMLTASQPGQSVPGMARC